MKEVTMSKQTAVEYLGYELNTKLFYNISPELWEEVKVIFQQALEMEKEQIVDAHFEGQCDNTEGYPLQIAKLYYNETYKGGQDE